MDAGAVERDLGGCRRKLKDLTASLARLESCRRELVARLGEVLSPDGSAGGGCSGGGTPPAAAGGPLFCRQRSGGDASCVPFPSSPDEELDWCLEMLKLRCQDVAEELGEVVLLAEALHGLARRRTAPRGAGGPDVPGGPALGAVSSTGAAESGAPRAAAAPSAPVGPVPSPPSAAAEPSPPSAAPSPPGAAPAQVRTAAPGAESLAALISSPHFQKAAAQLLAQLIRK